MSKRKRFNVYKDDNPWDTQRIPELVLHGEAFRYANAYTRNTQKVIDQMTKNHSMTLDFKAHLKRAKQLAYIEPWFQSFLPPNLRGHLFVCSIGYAYWVIGADTPLYANRFQYYQKEIRGSLEQHLNKISRQEWTIPDFKVRTIPKDDNDLDMNYMVLPISVPIRDTRLIAQERPSRRLEELIQRLDQKIDK